MYATVETVELVICSECGRGNFRVLTTGTGTCTMCGTTVAVWHDIVPYLNGRTFVLTDTMLAASVPGPDICAGCDLEPANPDGDCPDLCNGCTVFAWDRCLNGEPMD